MKHLMPRWFAPKLAVLSLTALAGCTRDVQDARLSRVTEQALKQQTQQNRAMAELQKNLQHERSHLDQERAQLADDARKIAAARHRDPIVANAIVGAVGLLVAVVATARTASRVTAPRGTWRLA
jgi:1-deoxy-D-xylulose 5-phosphate reductoisomerase